MIKQRERERVLVGVYFYSERDTSRLSCPYSHPLLSRPKEKRPALRPRYTEKSNAMTQWYLNAISRSPLYGPRQDNAWRGESMGMATTQRFILLLNMGSKAATNETFVDHTDLTHVVCCSRSLTFILVQRIP